MPKYPIREFIPQCNPDDREKLVAAYLEIWNDPANLPFLSFTLRPFEEAQVRKWFETHLDAGARYFCALDAHAKVLGIAVVRQDPLVGLEPMGIAVGSESKRQGIGTSLLVRVLELARELGLRTVEVAVFADNVEMLRLLLSMRFVPARIEHHRRADGVDLVYLRGGA